MRYQIVTYSGLIIDQNLSYEEALVYEEDPRYKKYTKIKPMKGGQTDSDSIS